MVKIVIENLAKKEVQTNDLSKSLLVTLQQHHIDWMHACGGKGRCTTCKLVITQGSENFLQLTEAETKYALQGQLASNERLACQAKIVGDVVIMVPEEGKLPHLTYNQ